MEKELQYRLCGSHETRKQPVLLSDTWRDVRWKINSELKSQMLLEWRLNDERICDDDKVGSSEFNLDRSIFDLVKVDTTAPDFRPTGTIRLYINASARFSTTKYLSLGVYLTETIEDVWRAIEAHYNVRCDNPMISKGNVSEVIVDPSTLLWDLDLTQLYRVWFGNATLLQKLRMPQAVSGAEMLRRREASTQLVDLSEHIAKLWESLGDEQTQAVYRLVRKTGFSSDYVVQVLHGCGGDENEAESCLNNINAKA